MLQRNPCRKDYTNIHRIFCPLSILVLILQNVTYLVTQDLSPKYSKNNKLTVEGRVLAAGVTLTTVKWKLDKSRKEENCIETDKTTKQGNEATSDGSKQLGTTAQLFLRSWIYSQDNKSHENNCKVIL